MAGQERRNGAGSARVPGAHDVVPCSRAAYISANGGGSNARAASIFENANGGGSGSAAAAGADGHALAALAALAGPR